MTKIEDFNLLPVGQEIDHEGDRLEILRPIGSGFTSEVYEGYLNKPGERIHVAIKAMKENGIPEEFKTFNQEFTTLSQIYPALARFSDSSETKISVPATYGLSEYEGRSYFVMDFINAESMRDKVSAGEKLKEIEVIALAKQLFLLLHVLHTAIKKTYIDLKLENLWYDRTNRQLFVTDFGTLEVKKDYGVKRDLLTAGVYLFAMLTGYMINAFNGELREDPTEVIQKAAISDGLKQFFLKLLHPNPVVRPTAASPIADQMGFFETVWNRPVAENIDLLRSLITDAQVKIKGSNLSGANVDAKNIKGISSILIEQGHADQLADIDSEIEEIFSETDVLAMVRQEFWRDRFNRARTLAEDHLKENIEPIDEDEVRQWWFLAKIAEKYPQEIKRIKPQLEILLRPEKQEMDSFSGGVQLPPELTWDQVHELIRRELPDQEEVEDLFVQIKIQKGLKELKTHFSQKDYDQALKKQFELQGLIQRSTTGGESSGNLPISSDQLSYLSVVISELNTVQNTFNEALASAHENAKEEKWVEVLEFLNQSYPSEVVKQTHLEGYQQLADFALQNKKFNVALQALEIARKYSLSPASYTARIFIIGKLKQIFAAQFNTDIDRVFDELRSKYHRYTHDPAFVEQVNRLLVEWAEKAYEFKDALFLKAVKAFLALTGDSDQAEQISIKVDQLEQERIDANNKKAQRLFEDAIHLFQFEKPELIFHRRSLADSLRLLMDRENGLKTCLSMLDSAKEMTSRDGLKSKVSDLETKVQAELDHLKNQHEQQNQQFTTYESTRLKVLREHWLELEILHKTDDQVGEVAFPTDLRAEIKKRITEDTRNLLDECIDYLANQDSTNEEVFGYFNQLIQRSEGGLSEDWQAFLTTSSDDNQHSKMMIDRVRELYLAGKSTEALNILNGFNPETSDLNRWLDLKSKLHEVEVFQAWAGNFNLEDAATDIINQKLDQVSRFVGYQLPMKYWVKSQVPKIVGEYYHNSYRKLISSQGYHQATFFDNLKRFLRVEYLIQTMPQEIAPMLPELEGTRRR